MKIFLTLSYLGTGFCGYQIQPKGRTVQGELNRAAKELFGFDCDVTGCSRTDSGVHAKGFVALVSGEDLADIPQESLPLAINSLLPDDISVLEATAVDSDFHPRYDVKYKEYVYKIWNGNVKNPFLGDRAFRPSFYISEEAIEQMRIAAHHFVGEHDFTAFMAKGSKITDAVRNVYYADVYAEGELIVFKVAADGFLYNMVRIMVGTLVEVARGNIEADDVIKIIDSRNRALAGATAPPHGLYLNKVSYINI